MSTFLVAAIVASLVLAIGLRQGLLSPLFTLSAIFLLGVVARWVFLLGQPGSTVGAGAISSNIGTLLSTTLLQFTLLIVLTVIGMWLVSSYDRRHLPRARWLSSPRLSPAGIAWASWAAILADAVSLALIARRLGGLSVARQVLRTRIAAPVAGLGYVATLMDLAVVLMAVANSQQLKRGTSTSQLRVNVGIAVTAGTLFFQAGRMNLIVFALIIGFEYLVLGHRSALAKVAICVALAVAMVGVVVSGLESRLSAQAASQRNVAAAPQAGLTASLSDSFPILDSYAAGVTYEHQTGTQGTSQLEQYASLLIPRTLWPSKPLSLPLKVRQNLYGNTLGGIPVTIYGEFYVGWGFTGALLGAIFFGLFLGGLRRVQMSAMADTDLLAGYLLIMFATTVTSFRSGLGVAITTGVLIALLMAAIRFVARRGWHSSPGPASTDAETVRERAPLTKGGSRYHASGSVLTVSKNIRPSP